LTLAADARACSGLLGPARASRAPRPRGGDWGRQSVAVDGRFVYVGGHFAPDFNGVTRTMLAAVDQTTGEVDSAFAQGLSHAYPDVLDLLATPNFLVAAGGFTRASGTAQARFALYPVIG
jgi:hypothetical protein